MKSNKHFPKYGKQKIRILTTDFWKCQGVFSLFLVFFFQTVSVLFCGLISSGAAFPLGNKAVHLKFLFCF